MRVEKKILVIDDNEEDREVVRRFVSRRECIANISFQLLEAASGAEGILLFQSEQPDCVLLDFSLPDMDGMEVLQQLNQQTTPERLCAIMFTGSGNEEIAVNAIKNGASDYLPKGSFSAASLCHAIENALDKTEIRIQLEQQRVLLKEKNEQLQKATEELEQKTRELERSNTELEQFAYAASHDLQEPLRAISGFVTLLNKKYAESLDTTGQEYIGYIAKGAERMNLLIQNLLDFSKVNSKKSSVEKVDLTYVLEKVTENLQRRIEESKAALIHSHLPVISANEWHMIQLFQNLISNAIKFRSKRPLQINITTEDKGEHFLFSVQDNGIGMDMKNADKIFQVFKRLHTRDEYEGTGIGLATCKRIVESYEGELWVYSEIDKGSTFYFTLKK